jgi:hypothetical protein
MKIFNNAQKVFNRKKLVFEKPEKGNRILVFDLGILPTIALLLLLLSTFGASIFFTKDKIPKYFSTKKSSDVAGQVSVSKTLISPVGGITLLSSGNTDEWAEYGSSKVAANKVPFSTLQVEKLPDVITSNLLAWNGISDLAASTSGIVEISFLALDTGTSCC